MSAKLPALARALAVCNRILERATFGLTALLAGAFFLVLVFAIVLRAFDFPLRASEELSSLAFVWACFSGASLCFRRDQHIRIRLLSDHLSPPFRQALDLALRLAITVFLVAVTASGAEMIILLGRTHMPISGLPQWVLYLPVVVFPAIMFLFNLEAMLRPTPPPPC